MIRLVHPGFSPALVGLTHAGGVGEEFLTPRPRTRPDGTPYTVPHRGVDILSRGANNKATSLPYTAGMVGMIDRVIETPNNAIVIRPHHNQEYLVVYLHSDRVFVSRGTVVMPWTTLGLTGNRGAEKGIHLHIHVIDEKGRCDILYEGWNNMCYVNPLTWPIDDSLAGRWTSTTSEGDDTLYIELIIHKYGDLIFRNVRRGDADPTQGVLRIVGLQTEGYWCEPGDPSNGGSLSIRFSNDPNVIECGTDYGILRFKRTPDF